MDREELPIRRWTLQLFGQIRLTDGERVVEEFVTRRSALLLARLALAHDRTLTRAAAAESLWPDDYFDATRVRLRQELARLRKALGDASGIIEVDGETIRLDQDVLVDVEQFRSLLRSAAKVTTSEQRIAVLAEAIDVGQEPLIEDSDDGWVIAERARLELDRYQALLDISEAHSQQGDFEAALAFARSAIAVQPSREEGRLLVVQALAALGHPADAMLELGVIRKGDPGTAQSVAPSVSLAAKSARPLRFAVPHPPEEIYGRDAEMLELAAQLDPTRRGPRLVSLLGPGGIGKSRLLIESALRLNDAFSGRVAYTDLSELHDARLVPLAILRSLRADAIPTENPVERLSAVIPEGPTLFALDNVEQLGARMQVFVRRLLERHPELKIVITSRGSLGLAGEHRVQVGPLPVPGDRKGATQSSPALKLFVQLAKSHGIDVDGSAAATSIVRRLEGVPLAIVLAAGRLRALGVQELSVQLEESFDVLATGRSGVPERHRSIRRAVEDSYNALTPDLQQVLSALAVFRGGWTLASASRVCGIEGALEVMEALLDLSLIYVSHEGRHIRFRMLESIRSYALGRLDDDIEATIRAAHGAWIADLARSVDLEAVTADSITCFDAADAEGDNIRAALEYALDRDPELAFHFGASFAYYWRYRSNGFEAFQFFADLFERYSDLAVSATAARAAYGQVIVLQMIDGGVRYDEQIRALRLCADANLVPECGRLHVIAGTKAQNEQEYEACVDHFRAAHELLSIYSGPCGWPFYNLFFGYCAYYQGRSEEAVALLEEAVDGFAKQGELFHQFRARQFLALSCIETGQIELAARSVSGLLEQTRSAGFQPMLAAIYNTEGKVAYHRGRYAEALEWFEASREEWLDRRIQWQISEQEHWMGRSQCRLGNLDAAESLERKATVSWYDIDSHTGAAASLFGFAEVLMRRGNLVESAYILDAGGTQIRTSGARILASEWAHHDEVKASLAAQGVSIGEGAGFSLAQAVDACRSPRPIRV